MFVLRALPTALRKAQPETKILIRVVSIPWPRSQEHPINRTPDRESENSTSVRSSNPGSNHHQRATAPREAFDDQPTQRTVIFN